MKMYAMKRILFIMILGLLPGFGWSQAAPAVTDSNRAATDTTAIDTLPDHGEAGGVDASDITSPGAEGQGSGLTKLMWLGFATCIAVGFGVGVYIGKSGQKKEQPEAPGASKLFIDEKVEVETDTKNPSPAAIRKLKEEIKTLKTSIEAARQEAAAYKKNLDVYAEFDQKYYGEAFRKLLSPANDAMEKGSRKELLEQLLKIMSHFGSITRYKISKKQPYDEANIQYLMNQKIKTDAATEIDRNTPVDKIPKHIKVLVDLLAEQSSGGLDESIISGYKIKNL